MGIEQLGPYRIERLLGRGGMGAVYAGVHIETGQRAAVKVLAETVADDPRFRERFRSEVETLKKLRHRNIVRLLGYGEEEGSSYFVMELVAGRSLDEELRARRHFAWQEVTDIGIQVAAALKHAHDHGVIHRDLKPANLLLEQDGTVKLTDFGIAKFFGGAQLTLAGSMIGTPDFMSPEQTEGAAVTPRSDLYSLGCVMYALLTGRAPFHGPSVTAVIDRVRREEARPVRMLAPQTPVELEQIIADLLRKNPAERVATAQLLSNQLQALRHALTATRPSPEPAPPTSPVADAERTRPTPGRVPPLPTTPTDASAAPTNADLLAVGPDAGRDDATQLSQPQRPPSSDSETVAYSTEAELEPADQEPRTTQFTPVSDADWHEAVQTAQGATRTSLDRILTALMAVLLLGIIGLAAYRLIPESADRLYQRITDSGRQNPLPTRYSRDLDEFLERFPNDPRAAEVDRLRSDLRCQWLEEELANKFRELAEEEELYLRGRKAAEREQWTEAAACFQEIIDRYQDALPNASSDRLVERSAHMLDTIRRRRTPDAQ
jgi:serine/threonine-protein kinase